MYIAPPAKHPRAAATAPDTGVVAAALSLCGIDSELLVLSPNFRIHGRTINNIRHHPFLLLIYILIYDHQFLKDAHPEFARESL